MYPTKTIVNDFDICDDMDASFFQDSEAHNGLL